MDGGDNDIEGKIGGAFNSGDDAGLSALTLGNVSVKDAWSIVLAGCEIRGIVR